MTDGHDAPSPQTGSGLLVRQLVALGVRHFFFIIGGPMSDTITDLVAAGLTGIDTRDERAATFAAIAYSRLTGAPAVVVTCSGPGTTNTVTGLAHAHADGAPVIVLGGSAARYLRGTGAFQELDQTALMAPVTKLSFQVPDADGVPDAVTRAFQVAMSGAPGPVYLDFPSDVLYGTCGGPDAAPIQAPRPRLRASGDPDLVTEAAGLIRSASRPVAVFGSGVLWSGAATEMRALVETAGIPFYSTPMARGIIGDRHPLSFPAARSLALRETDCLTVIGTRDNYVVNNLKPPVVSGSARLIEINAEPADISRNRLADVGIVADARLALTQLTAELAARPAGSYQAWTDELGVKDAAAREAASVVSDQVPIHPARLCQEIEKVRDRAGVVVLDGAAILDFGRRILTADGAGQFMTPGVFGTMGVGVPFGLGARLARPDLPVLVLTGDGAFGYHALEIDTAVRHKIGMVVVIANNGGWTSKRGRPGYALRFSDYHDLAAALGAYSALVCEPAELPVALKSALGVAARESRPAVVNVITSTDRLQGRGFSRHARHSGAEYDAV